MANGYYGFDGPNDIDKSVNRMFITLALSLFSIILLVGIFFMQTQKANEINKNVNVVTTKVDTAISITKHINQNLESINQKLDESIQGNENIIDSIGEVNKDVNKVNRSVQRVGKNVDTLIIYIKK